MATIPKVKFPQSPFVDATTGRISREWQQWLLNPQFISVTLEGVIGADSGGTGTGDIPGVGQILIGNGTAYGIGNVLGVTNQIAVNSSNTEIRIGISPFYGGQASISTVGTITSGTWQGNTISAAHGGTGLSSYNTGDLLVAADATSFSRLPAVVSGSVLKSMGDLTAPAWGPVNLATDVTGTLPPARGGATSGDYTPTITPIVNVSATTIHPLMYYQIGNKVTVAGRVDIDAINNAVSTQIAISLPIPSNIASSADCAGTADSVSATTESGVIYGDPGADRAILAYTSTTTALTSFFFIFCYRVLP